MTESSLPAWAFPPPEGFTAEDLDRVPQPPAHTELIDGTLVFVSPQASFHTLMTYLLKTGLRRTAPAEFRVRREMSVVLGRRQRPEPDISVIRASAEHSPEQTFHRAEDVLLAVEVVSPDSEERDRERRPVLYAQAGIPHFWLVENRGGKPAVYVYELDPAARRYVLTGVHHDLLKVTAPFDAGIDLTEVDTL